MIISGAQYKQVKACWVEVTRREQQTAFIKWNRYGNLCKFINHSSMTLSKITVSIWKKNTIHILVNEYVNYYFSSEKCLQDIDNKIIGKRGIEGKVTGLLFKGAWSTANSLENSSKGEICGYKCGVKWIVFAVRGMQKS